MHFYVYTITVMVYTYFELLFSCVKFSWLVSTVKVFQQRNFPIYGIYLDTNMCIWVDFTFEE